MALYRRFALPFILLLSIQGCDLPGDPQLREVSIVLRASQQGDEAFSPNPVVVPLAGTVVWTNDDNVVHSVVGDAKEGPCAFDSGPIGPDKRFRKTFYEPVECSYYCGFHGRSMRGKIKVE